jgi:hypothetical protein
LLAVLTHGIDMQANGGEITISSELVDDQVQLDFVDGRANDDPDAFVVRALLEVVANSLWSIQRQSIDAGFRVRLKLPRQM